MQSCVRGTKYLKSSFLYSFYSKKQLECILICKSLHYKRRTVIGGFNGIKTTGPHGATQRRHFKNEVSKFPLYL